MTDQNTLLLSRSCIASFWIWVLFLDLICIHLAPECIIVLYLHQLIPFYPAYVPDGFVVTQEKQICARTFPGKKKVFTNQFTVLVSN